jgi:hypothetical protein
MQAALQHRLQRQRAEIRRRWEILLRIERAPTPLALPDTLIHLFDHTFDEVLHGLTVPQRGTEEARPEPACACNPMRMYFIAFEQALMEALVLSQAADPAPSAEERTGGARTLSMTVRRIARRELALYDGLCQQKRPVNSSD